MTFDTITTLFPWLLPVGSFFLVIFLLLLLVVVVSAQQNRQYLRRQAALQSYVFPQMYMDDVKLRYPHLTEADLAIAFEELRFYFYLCWKKQPKTVVMPSRLVDVCWHVFITDTRQYQQYCENVYGQFLHHMPRVEVDLPQPEEQNEQEQADDGDVAKEAKKRRLAIKAQ